MDKPKLNFRFHNANTPEATVLMILDGFMAANKKKADEAVNRFKDQILAEEAEATRKDSGESS